MAFLGFSPSLLRLSLLPGIDRVVGVGEIVYGPPLLNLPPADVALVDHPFGLPTEVIDVLNGDAFTFANHSAGTRPARPAKKFP